MAAMLSERQLLRYSAQLLLDEHSEAKQQALQQARVLIVGVGGLGSIVASYLAGAGVGELILADDDNVSLSNLPRQLLYTTAEVGKAKVLCAQSRLLAQNPEVSITALPERVTLSRLSTLLPKVQLVLDCTDNVAARMAINHACYLHQVPLVTAAANGWHTQLLALRPWQGQGCYHCLYPDWQDSPACMTSGIFGPVVGSVASQQALLALKVLLGLPHQTEMLIHTDYLTGQSVNIQLVPDPACRICGHAQQERS